LPDAAIGLAVAGRHGQSWHATKKRLVALRQEGPNPLDKIRQPERMDAVPAPFIGPIVQRHGSILHASHYREWLQRSQVGLELVIPLTGLSA